MAARPRVVAALAAQFRDLDLAEDGFSAALEIALGQREIDNPRTFLYVTARRRILDMQRRSRRSREREDRFAIAEERDVEHSDEGVPDERLRLLFICCHPALGIEARVMLALRVVLGVGVPSIASGFLLKEDAVRRRITRAKVKIREARVAFELPPRDRWPERLAAILLTLEVAYAAAYREGALGELAEETERLAMLLVELLPRAGEVVGLAAVILLARSREAARAAPLSEQDPALWDRKRIIAAQQLLDRDFDGPIGRFRLLALIHLTHARRIHDDDTDWAAILRLYDALFVLDASPVIAVNRALAMGRAGDPMRALEALPEEMPTFAGWYAARGELLAMAGRAGAAAAFGRALALTEAPAARALLQRHLSRVNGA